VISDKKKERKEKAKSPKERKEKEKEIRKENPKMKCRQLCLLGRHSTIISYRVPSAIRLNYEPETVEGMQVERVMKRNEIIYYLIRDNNYK